MKNKFYSNPLYEAGVSLKNIVYVTIVSIIISIFLLIGQLSAENSQDTKSYLIICLFVGLGSIIVILYLLFKAGDCLQNSKASYPSSALDNPTNVWECPKCKTINSNTSFKCSKCGYSLI